jgi:tRNA(Ile2) C34 agmatinyltransferase TiaS
VIFVGIDDTDTKDNPGTNQLARAAVSEFGGAFFCERIVRHQLLFDPRVPYTSKNSCCSLLVRPAREGESALIELRGLVRKALLRRFQPGSDPGLCVTEIVPAALTDFGRRCQQVVVPQDDARDLARQHEISLEGLGGTEDGVIGALAAVGLAVTGDDGRVVQIQQQPDDLTGPESVARIRQAGVDEIRWGNEIVTSGTVDVGKHLRPNLRGGRILLFVEPSQSEPDRWTAVRQL